MKLFVAAMGASNHTYAEAVATECLEDWIGAHVRMFAFLGGVPKVVVPDNLKAAVIKADRFDPGLNRTYAEMAAHYDTAILPARPRRPKDKAKVEVEVAVQVAQRWILARLRNHRFFSLAELNVAIRRLLDQLNMRVMRGYGASCADLFATLDRPHLRPLLRPLTSSPAGSAAASRRIITSRWSSRTAYCNRRSSPPRRPVRGCGTPPTGCRCDALLVCSKNRSPTTPRTTLLLFSVKYRCGLGQGDLFYPKR